MKYTYFSLFLIALLTASCGINNKETKTVNDFKYSQKQITDLLTDMQTFESIVSTHKFFNDKDEKNLVFQKILEKHEINRNEYDSIIKYISRNIEMYQQIIDSIKIKIENMEEIDLPYIMHTDTTKKKKPKPRLKS